MTHQNLRRICCIFIYNHVYLALNELAFYSLVYVDWCFCCRMWSQEVRQRIRDTYMYFGASIGFTALAAVAASRSQLMMSLMMRNSWLVSTFCLYTIIFFTENDCVWKSLTKSLGILYLYFVHFILMGISPMGNSGCFTQGKPAATKLHYPSLINYKVHAGSFRVSIWYSKVTLVAGEHGHKPLILGYVEQALSQSTDIIC